MTVHRLTRKTGECTCPKAVTAAVQAEVADLAAWPELEPVGL